jgi:hypothetical protein
MNMKRMAGLVLLWFGRAWLTLAGVVIIAGYAGIWFFQGFGALQDTLSPFNVWNYIAVLGTLAPGLLALHISERMGGPE